MKDRDLSHPQLLFPAEKGIHRKGDLSKTACYPLHQLMVKNKKIVFVAIEQ